MKTEQKVLEYLLNNFKIDEVTAKSTAKKIAFILDGYNDNWIDVSKALPEAEDLKYPDAEYYFVNVEYFGTQKAMYLFDEDGNEGWYLSYIAKLIKPVTHFKPII